MEPWYNEMSDNLVENLRELLNKPLDPSLFPVKKGNKINIGSYVVIKTKDCYIVKSYKSNSIVAECSTKSAAIAIAKTLHQKKNHLATILTLDKEFSKYYNDCVFYKHTLKVSKDNVKKAVVSNRYDISMFNVLYLKKKIENFIY